VRTIVRITVLEAARRKLLWALLGLTVATVVLTGWGFERLVSLARANHVLEIELQVGLSQTLILVAFMFSFVLAMTAAFMAAPALASDIESGVALAVLARPIRRSDLLLGKWLGLAIVIATYSALAGMTELAMVRVVTGYTPPDPIGAVSYLAFEAIVLLSLALVLGSRLPAIAGGAIVVVVYGLAWIAGVMGAVGAFFGTPVLVQAAEASRLIVPIDGLWRGAVFSLEPTAMIAIIGSENRFQGNPFFASAPPSLAYLAWSVIWITGVLGVGIWLLRRREI
jgi:ABC-type transport system involved in multi-copper enzyme maturation permease subunit